MTDPIKQFFKGEIKSDDKTLELYSHDTSLFELKPEAVLYPENVSDLKKLVKYVSENKEDNPNLSITPRSAGTDMGGGSINDSLIVDFTKHFHQIGEINAEGTWVQPGTFYRDFEKKTLRLDLYIPSFPASKGICALGGMIANNSGGEESLVHGKTINYVEELKMILSDGEEYHFQNLNKKELGEKLKQDDFEGGIYKAIYKLITENYDLIKNARPKVSKNSTGYNIWDVYDKETESFNLAKIFVGAQGTLGLNTDIKIKLIHAKKYSGLLVVFLEDMKLLPALINDVVATKPDSFEAFDDHTLSIAIRFIPQFIQILGLIGTIHMALEFIPDLINFAIKGIPKFTLLIEYEGDSQDEVSKKIEVLHQTISHYPIKIKEAKTKQQAENYWVIRRQSFNLLRKNVKDKHTAPFIDDFVIPPASLLEFWPKLMKILNDHEIDTTIAGHMGDGNFHIIPLMNFSDPKEIAKIPVVQKLVNQLVIDFHGSISGEHNDGLIRGFYLEMMYGKKVFEIFKEIKTIFDPLNIFNPHKKTAATAEYSFSHIRDHF